MQRILITSGPTREYLDPVRYLSNASSGQMGSALAAAALAAGHEAVIVSGPVSIAYPSAAEVIRVTTTEEMAAASREVFPRCDGLIAAAAPCDYRPKTVAEHKLHKQGGGLTLELEETEDIVASLSALKTRQWMVAFALETRDRHLRALKKLEVKKCDLIVANGPAAIEAAGTQVEVLDRGGEVVGRFSGAKGDVAAEILALIAQRLMRVGQEKA